MLRPVHLTALFLALVFCAAPARAGAAADSTDAATGRVADGAESRFRGPLIGALIGGVLEGGNGGGFRDGSDVGLVVGYRFDRRWSMTLGPSWQSGKGSSDFMTVAWRGRFYLRPEGAQPYFQGGPAAYFFKAPNTPIVSGNRVPVAWRPAEWRTDYGFTLGVGAEAPVDHGFFVGAGISYYFVIDEASYSGGNAMDFYSLGVALTFAPR